MVDSNQKLSKDNRFNIDLIYPVGSIYMSVNDVDPSNLFGGIWERIKDTFLLAAGDNYAVGSTGGQASHAHTIPVGFDKNRIYWYTIAGSDIIEPAYGSDVFSTSELSLSTKFSYAKQKMIRVAYTTITNSMPPYLAIYVWKRVK